MVEARRAFKSLPGGALSLFVQAWQPHHTTPEASFASFSSRQIYRFPFFSHFPPLLAAVSGPSSAPPDCLAAVMMYRDISRWHSPDRAFASSFARLYCISFIVTAESSIRCAPPSFFRCKSGSGAGWQRSDFAFGPSV